MSDPTAHIGTEAWITGIQERQIELAIEALMAARDENVEDPYDVEEHDGQPASYDDDEGGDH